MKLAFTLPIVLFHTYAFILEVRKISQCRILVHSVRRTFEVADVPVCAWLCSSTSSRRNKLVRLQPDLPDRAFFVQNECSRESPSVETTNYCDLEMESSQPGSSLTDGQTSPQLSVSEGWYRTRHPMWLTVPSACLTNAVSYSVRAEAFCRHEWVSISCSLTPPLCRGAISSNTHLLPYRWTVNRLHWAELK